jgi:hypothetical protein
MPLSLKQEIVHAPPPQPKPRWKPSKEYWFVNLYCGVGWSEVGFEHEEKLFAVGNCFPTREKAEAAAQAIKELLNKLNQ